MSERRDSPYTFYACFVQDRDTFRVISQHDVLLDQDATISNVMEWDRDEESWSYYDLEWQATRVSMLFEPRKTIFAIGPLGVCSVVDADGDAEEELDPGATGPRGRGHIRDLCSIGGEIYAAGMGRQFYRRTGPRTWQHEDAGIAQPVGVVAVSGFNAVDGLDAQDIFAVGFGGEIWRRQGGLWRAIASPTNLVLLRVRVVAPDLQFACGQQGVILRGRGDAWEVVQHDEDLGDLWGMEWYRDHLYLAGDDGLFRLAPDGTLARVDTGLPEATYRHLHAADGVLLSSGPKHVLFTEDGAKWTDITP